jgi:hypothetical protein
MPISSQKEAEFRDAALDAFDAGLQRIGYPSTQIQRDYGFSVKAEVKVVLPHFW